MASPLRRKVMKKELANKMADSRQGSSRPSSASSVSSSSRASGAHAHRTKDRGPSKDELVKANTELNKEVELLNEENQHLKSTISAVIEKFVENAKIKGVRVPAEVNNPNVGEVSTSCLVSFAEKLTAEAVKTSTMEYRVEELETRITHLNMELAKLLRTRVNVETVLDEIVTDCDSSVEEVKQKSRELLTDLRSSSLFTFLDGLPIQEEVRPSSTSPEPPEVIKQTIEKPRIQSTSNNILINLEQLDLTLPLKKFPGDTHIKKMHKDLRQYVIHQLSLPKGNGADWRLMGERLGIPSDTIQQWRRWKLDSPMLYVLQTWGQSPGATVRLLHRHLVSPQMRSSLLAKRISDFYLVD